jgi:hypothetical protein
MEGTLTRGGGRSSVRPDLDREVGVLCWERRQPVLPLCPISSRLLFIFAKASIRGE